MENNETKPADQVKKPEGGTALRILILFGILIVLIVGMALTVIYLPKGLDSLASVSVSSLFKPKEKITVSVDKTVLNSGDTVTASWNGPIRSDGVYTISYACKAGVSAIFHSGQNMTCEQPFYFSSPDNTASLVLFSSASSQIDVPVYINFKDTAGNTSIVGDVLVTINAPGGNTVTSTTSTTTAPVLSNPVAIPQTTIQTEPAQSAKFINLDVHITAIGYIDSSNTFTQGLVTPTGDRPAVRFSIGNSGTISSGPWSFEAITPSSVKPVLQSGPEPSLLPGTQIQFTLGFDDGQNGGTVTISVNPNRSVAESTYADNVASYTIGGNGNAPVAVQTIGENLSAHINSISIINGNHAVVSFVITNLGTEKSGGFTWTATLPSNDDSTYVSAAEPALNPGDSIEFSASFDYAQNINNNTVTISVGNNSTSSVAN